jgi:glycosyltransferase involved in cell wall biosynthesis
VVRIAAALRRTPYVYDAADMRADATVTITRSRLIPRLLLAIERFGLRGALHAFVVAAAYSDRMRELDIRTPTSIVGFGVDTTTFDYSFADSRTDPLFVYPGSYSEWHGAEVFVEAFARFHAERPEARLLFVGNGSERPQLERHAAELGIDVAVKFRDTVPGTELAGILATATASLASLRPGGYDYAFATKIYSSLAVGCPVIFSGAGPAGPFITTAGAVVRAGVSVAFDPDAVSAAMHKFASVPASAAQRRELSTWTRTHHSLTAVSQRVVDAATDALRGRREAPGARATRR